MVGCVSIQVFRTSWWAAHYRAPTPKRHYCYCNSPAIVALDKGKLTGWKNIEKSDKNKTAVQYKNSTGKVCFKGTKALKRTEWLAISSISIDFESFSLSVVDI